MKRRTFDRYEPETMPPAEFVEANDALSRPAHFRIKSVPLPAEVRRRRWNHFNEKTKQVEIVEMYVASIACPHCLRDVDFAFPQPSIAEPFAHELMDAAANGDRQTRQRLRAIEEVLAAAAALNVASAYSPIEEP